MIIHITINDYTGITVCEITQVWGAAIIGDNAEDRAFQDSVEDRAFQATLEQLPPELWQETIKEYERMKQDEHN